MIQELETSASGPRILVGERDTLESIDGDAAGGADAPVRVPTGLVPPEEELRNLLGIGIRHNRERMDHFCTPASDKLA